MKKNKLTLIMLLLTVATSPILTSCMTTKTSVGTYKEDPGNEYTYAKGKQLWLFWGIVPVGRTNVNTPGDGNCEVITRYNFGDVLISGLTVGIVKSYTIKIKAKNDQTESTALNKPDIKTGDIVIFSKGKLTNQEGEVVAIYPDRALIKFTNQPDINKSTKETTNIDKEQIEVPFINIAKK